MNIYIELLLHITLDSLAEGHNLTSRCATQIDENQCLTVMYASTSQRLTLPSTLFYHPSCRNLLVFRINGIMGHIRILRSQLFILAARHYGIHEEAACIARLLGIRQLGITDVYNHLAQLLGRRLSDTSALQLRTDIAVVKSRTEFRRELIFDTRNQETVLPLLLKATLAIAVCTILTLPVAISTVHTRRIKSLASAP